MTGGPEAAVGHPLVLLRDYSNEDKHRTIRLAAGRSLVQRPDDWERSVGLGMRHLEVGTVIEQVQKGVLTGVEVSPALHLQRPDDGVWANPGPELDALARHVSDIVIPMLVTCMALPDTLPAEVDLSDTGESLVERLVRGGSTRAHDRGRALSLKAYFEAMEQDVKFPPITSEFK